MKNQEQKQQGDVTFRRIEASSGKVGRKAGRIVLAEGEHTGHAHVLESDDAELIMDGEKMLVRLTRAAVVTHEEHGPITLDPGVWEVGRVVEHDYLTGMVNQVLD